VIFHGINWGRLQSSIQHQLSTDLKALLAPRHSKSARRVRGVEAISIMLLREFEHRQSSHPWLLLLVSSQQIKKIKEIF
jgi:hypothetical protein